MLARPKAKSCPGARTFFCVAETEYDALVSKFMCTGFDRIEA